MRKSRQNSTQKGITLIALVVTIVVLLILAGITINLLFSNNGIIKKAQEAKEKTEKAEIKEKIQFAIQEIQTNQILENKKITMEAIIKELGNYIDKTGEKDYTWDSNQTSTTPEGSYRDYPFYIDENYIVHIDETIQFSYTILSVNEDKTINIEVTVKDRINGLTVIETPDGNSINCNNEKEKILNYTITKGQNYLFNITNSKNKQVEKNIKIDKILPTSIQMSSKQIFCIDKPVKIEYKVEPEFADIDGLIWKSSDESVATVSSDGTITGLKEGETTITLMTSNQIKAECQVKMKEVLYLYQNGDTCEEVTSNWNHIGGRYYPESYAKLEENHINLYHGGYIATDLKNIDVSQFNYINVEVEGTYQRNMHTDFYAEFYDELGSYTNENAWSNFTKRLMFWNLNTYGTFEKQTFSLKLEGISNKTKAISIHACEGKDYKMYSVSLSYRNLGEIKN